jgi:signal transduction histidine kinase
MRVNIATKLFAGFIVIILLNASFVLIVSKLATLNSVATMLKMQNEVKNHFIRLTNLHIRQTRSRFIYTRIRKEESVENFKDVGNQVQGLLDSIITELQAVEKLDSSVSEGHIYSSDLRQIVTVVGQQIGAHHVLYKNSFEEMVGIRNTSTAQALDRVQFLNALMDSADEKMRVGIATSDSLIDVQTMQRVKQIEKHISNVKKLTLIIVLGISIFSLLFGFFISRVTTNSLRRLRESTRSIAKGEFDFNPAGYPKDEIGDLATAFFDMAHDLKKAQAELIRSKRLAAIGEIVASVNHEINNPLMIISGNAQFLEMSMDEGYPPDMKERVRAILDETERISRVTRKLRDIKQPVVEDYTSSGEQMINLDKSV